MNVDMQKLLDEIARMQAPGAAAPTAAELLRAARRLCDAEGHRYQVAGRLSPAQVRCSRCRCTWAIGPKTEPTS